MGVIAYCSFDRDTSHFYCLIIYEIRGTSFEKYCFVEGNTNRRRSNKLFAGAKNFLFLYLLDKLDKSAKTF